MISKQQRAKQHIDEATRLIQSYFSETPVRLSIRTSECGQWNIVCIDEIAKCSDTVLCAVGDALFNLRSSLDHMMMSIALKHVSPQTLKAEKVYFPIKNEEADYREWRGKDYHAKQLPTPILDALDTFRPFKSGSVLLWTLHQLNNIDKHRNLVISAINYKSINLLSMFDKESLEKIVGEKYGDMMAENMSNLWINDKNMNLVAAVGQEITRYRVGKTPGDPIVKFDFSVIEANVEVKPVIALLGELYREVASVNSALESFL